MKLRLVLLLLSGVYHLNAQISEPLSGTTISVDSSRSPVFYFNCPIKSGCVYRWGFYHDKDISIYGGRFIESESDSFDKTGRIIRHDYRDSTGEYFACAEISCVPDQKDTICIKIRNYFKTDGVPLYRIFCPDCCEKGSSFRDIIQFKDTLSYFSILIFDRFGSMVYTSENQFDEWNGLIQVTESSSPEGNYYYLITYISGKNSSKRETLNGSFKLIRRHR